MTEKNKIFLLKVILVVVALALGFSLNMFQFRAPFTSVGTEQATSQKEGVPPEPRWEQPAGKQQEQPPVAMSEGKRDQAALPGQQDGASREIQQAPADSPAAVPSSDAKPSALAASEAQEQGGKAMQPAESGQSAQETKELPSASAVDAAKQPAVYVVQTESGPEESSSAPKVLSDEKAARAAKIGRQVPADAQAAKGADAPAKDGAQMTSAAKPEKAKQQIAQAEVSDQDTGQAKGMEKAGKSAARNEGGQPGPAGTEAKEAQPGKPEKNKPGVQEKSLPEASDRQTASASDALSRQAEKAAAAKGGRVVDVTAQDNPDEFVLTITTDGPVERVTSFYAKDPARLAVDIWGGWHSGVPGVIAVGGPLMERIRIGAHPDKLRLVVDYRDKDSVGHSEPVVEKKDKGVVVRVPKGKVRQ
jgi:hypothetical protein